MLFPTLARFASRGEHDNLRATMANGMRQILFVLIPAAAAVLVLSEPMIRLVYQRGEFTPDQTTLVATALFWFAFSLPTNGLFLLLTRTFFSLQRPWVPTGIAAGNLAVTALAALALYHLGVGGIVAATAIATTVSVVAQCVILRRILDGLELGRLLATAIRITLAAAALAAVSFGVWDVLDGALGRGLVGQVDLARRRPRPRPAHLPGRRQADEDRRARPDRPPPAPPLDARPRPLPARRRGDRRLRRLRLAGRRPPSDGAWSRDFSGAPAHLATSVLALALLIWVAELLGTFGAFEAVPYLLAVVLVGVAIWTLLRRVAGDEGGRGRAWPAAPPSSPDRTRRPGRSTSRP